MKIVNVTPGIISIPPNGWGAVEKIIWEIHNNLLHLGYDSSIKFLDEVNKDDDIIHIHVANLANIAHEKGIPYYFTMHDHHTVLYGKDSSVYKENLLAIKNAKKAFVPAKYLVEYFDNIPIYFSHGVNTDYFIPNQIESATNGFLCIANNGYIHDHSYDRKGFSYAIEIARKFDLPITIAGPSNNKHYFEHAPKYNKLKVLYDIDESTLKSLYQSHSIFLHFSELEAGHPNLTLLEAMASGMPVIGTFESNNSLAGLKKVNRKIDDITIDEIADVIINYNQYKHAAIYSANTLSWKKRTIELLNMYDINSFREQLIESYNNTEKYIIPSKKHSEFLNINYIEGPYAELVSNNDKEYIIEFINSNTEEIEYSTKIKHGYWSKVSKQYFIPWKIVLKELDNTIIKEYELNFTHSRVYIALESKSLGDTLAWIPYVEEFRKKHNCDVICSTFLNELFTEVYPHIKFVNPGEVVNDIVAMYTVGIYYKDDLIDFYKHPINPITVPLQKVSSDILGLEFNEIKPLIPLKNNLERKKYVTIAIHSTSQAKYWNNPNGWQDVVTFLKTLGYKVILLSEEEDGYMGNSIPNGIYKLPKSPINKVIEQLQSSTLFIGISSGLSWLSWATNTPTCIISGFTKKFNEFNCIRISPKDNTCEGCYNEYTFDKGDWGWCPLHKNTSRQFECTKTISAQDVIDAIKSYI